MDELILKLREFVKDRDWEQFHTPKNLSTGLCIEAAELAEVFLWLTPEQSCDLSPEKLEAVKDEIGDVLIYLVRLADVLGIDPLAAAMTKHEKTKQKYPADLVRGKALKYTEYK